MSILKNKIRISFWLLLVFVIAFLLYKGIVPGGYIFYTYDFSSNNSFIGNLSPSDRLSDTENGDQKIIGDPVYFSLRTPRRFNRAKLTIKYRDSKNSVHIPIIEAGVLMDKTIWNYKLKSVENKIIDNISLVWDEIREGDLVLLQNNMLPEEKKYKSIDEFLENLPPREKIALYNYNLNSEYLIKEEDINLKEDKVIIDYSLRGAYQFYIYNTKDIDIKFKFSNLNKNDDEDPIDIFLYYKDEIIDSRRLEHGDDREVVLNEVNMPEGLYKVGVKVNDDIITESIETNLDKLSFINKIWLAKKGGEDIKIYTDGRRIHAQTVNADSLQIIRFADTNLVINETFNLFSSDLKNASSSVIELEKDGVIIATDGVFSFTGNSLINPSYKKVTTDLDIKKEGINYVLANYKTPANDGEWKIANIVLDISSAYRELSSNLLGGTGTYGFMISIPELRVNDEVDDYVDISEIKIELMGTKFIDYFKKLFK